MPINVDFVKPLEVVQLHWMSKLENSTPLPPPRVLVGEVRQSDPVNNISVQKCIDVKLFPGVKELCQKSSI